MSAGTLETLLLLFAAGSAALVVGVLMLKRPFLAVATTVVSLPLVPFWMGLSIGGFFVNVHMALALGSTFAVLRARRHPLRPAMADWLFLGVFGFSVLSFVLGFTTIAQTYALFGWLVFYAFARVAAATYGLPRIARWFVGACVVAAVAIVAEAATDVNLWVRHVRMDNALFNQWSNLQSRGGVLRAEGAFGHSIAAGSVLAMASTLAFVTRWRTSVKLLAVAVLSVATVLTISRLGIVSFGLGVLLTALLARGTGLSRRLRAGLVGLVGVGALGVVLGLADIFAESGDEAANSAAYRTWLVELLPSIQPVGMAESFSRSTAGGTSFGDFRSLDSALLLFALTQGWVPSLIVLGLVVALLFRVVRLQAGPAALAVVAQLPALAGVALITQYGSAFWLVVGLAVTEALPRPAPPARAAPPAPLAAHHRPPSRATGAPRRSHHASQGAPC